MSALRVLNYCLLLLPLAVIGQGSGRKINCIAVRNHSGFYTLKTSFSKTDFYKARLYTGQGKLLWERKTPGEVTGCLAGNDGKAYITTQDTFLLCLDKQGNELWTDQINGSHGYKQILPYKNGFVVLVDETIYRMKFDDPNMEDYIVYYEYNRDQDHIWTKSFPGNATVKIMGDHIYAVYYRHKKLIRKRVY